MPSSAKSHTASALPANGNRRMLRKGISEEGTDAAHQTHCADHQGARKGG